MRNSDYWKKRFIQLEKGQNEIGVSAFSSVEQQYRQAQKEIEGEIAIWYQRFADNNKISLAQSRQWLTGANLKEFKRDVQDYIKYGQGHTLSGSWEKRLESVLSKTRISKLEALKIQTQHSLEVMFAEQHKTISDTMKKAYIDGYYHTAYELQRGFNFGRDISGLEQSQIEKIISKPWAADNLNFSQRIWNSKQKLIADIQKELTQNLLTGGDPQEVINAIEKKMNTSKNNAGRLIMTDQAYFSSAAQKKCYEDLGVEQYEIIATLDSHTSEICQNLNGKVFSIKDYEVGVTAPPFHVFCRSTTAPVFDEDNLEFGGVSMSEDMSFDEWKQEYVGGENSGLTNAENGGIIKEYKLADEKKFSFSDYDVVTDSESIEKFKAFALENFGITNIGGIELLENGKTALEIVEPLKQLAKEYGKQFSRITIENMGDSMTIASTLTSELKLNSQFLNRPEALKFILDRWESTGYIPKGCNNAAYVGKHEFSHLLTQDLINDPKSKIVTCVDRAIKDGCEIISGNAKTRNFKDPVFYHEFVADLLTAPKPTAKQTKLKNKILQIFREMRQC